jgi:DNA-binding MurR/RpiR family transcriptional regulator
MTKSITAEISERLSSFSKGQRRIADAILNSYEKVAYMTAAKLGEFCEVSESTVVRFANELGYAGYPDMQHAVQELVRTKLTPNQRIEVTNRRLGNRDVLQNVLSADAERIKYTLEHIDKETFKSAVDSLLNAKNIYIFGARSSASLAYFLSYNLELIFDHVKFLQPSSAGEVFEQILTIEKGDVLFAISFPRYSKKVVDAVRYAQKEGATVIALTDSPISPLSEYADHLLTAQSDMASFVDSLVAPLSILNATLAAIAKERQSEITQRFDKLERIWDEYDVYDKH